MRSVNLAQECQVVREAYVVESKKIEKEQPDCLSRTGRFLRAFRRGIRYRVIFEHFNCKPQSSAALGSGAKPSYSISVGETPLAVARANGQSDVVELLEKKLKERFPVRPAAKKGDVKAIERLLDEGADVDGAANGLTALFIACENGQVDAAQLLLDRGADLGCLTRVASAPNTAAGTPPSPTSPIQLVA